MFSFFKENGKTIEPNPDLLTIPEFYKIWERDTTRSKVKAKNDFAIIYMGGYFDSPMNAYGRNKWKKIGEKFKNDSTWTPDKDEDIQAALKSYEEMQRTPSLRILNTIRESLETSDAVIQQVSKNIQEIALRQEEAEDDDSATKNMGKLFDYITKLLNLQGKIPQSINSIIDLEKKVYEEVKQNKVRGGGSIGSRENPERYADKE